MKNKILGIVFGIAVASIMCTGIYAAALDGISDVSSSLSTTSVQTSSALPDAPLPDDGIIEVKGLNGLDVKINYSDHIPSVCRMAEFTEKTEGVVFDEKVDGYVYKITTKHYTLDPLDVKSLFYKIPDTSKPSVLDVSSIYKVDVSEETNDTNWEFRDSLNGYLKTNIVLKIGKCNVKATPSAIKEWVKIDNQNNTATIDRNKVWVYVNGLVKMFNTSDKYRNFATTNSGTVAIAPGSYGWKTDFTGVTDKLYEAIQNKSDITITVGCSQSGYCMPSEVNDFGNSYVELSIAKQHMWIYKNGNLMLESDVVTGNPTTGMDTPKGAWFLMSMSTNAVLVGADYRTPVAYWMPFTESGCGLHDATWQPWFGGNRYITNGSHGCVNLPLEVAKQTYETIATGYPVIVY